MAAALIPPFVPAESPPPDEDVVLVLAGVAEAPELAVELEVGAPRHTNDPVMPPLRYSCCKGPQSKCLVLRRNKLLPMQARFGKFRLLILISSCRCFRIRKPLP
jgi:hypothetical protein